MVTYFRTPDKRAYCKNFLYFSFKTYVVDTQKNRLNETVLLALKTHVKIGVQENNYNFTLIKFPYLDLSLHT